MSRVSSISFLPQNLDLALYAGDGAKIRLVVKDQVTQALIDVSGDHAAQIRTSSSDTDALDTFDVDDLNSANGEIILSLTADQTTDLGNNFKGVWDYQWTAPGEEPMTLVKGKITCTLDVTRS
jgi:chitodextrinase